LTRPRYRSIFFTDTRGTGILTRLYLEHQPFLGPIDHMRKGVLVCMAGGKTTEYAMNDLGAPETRKLKSETRNLKPDTRNTKPEPRTPTPHPNT